MKLFSTLILLMLAGLSMQAQQGYWNDLDSRSLSGEQFQARHFKVNDYRALTLDWAGMQAALQAVEAGNSGTELLIPMPDGSMKLFRVVDAPAMAPGLAARYPAIKSYKGWNPERPEESISLGYGPSKGFYATVLSAEGAVYIDGFRQDGRMNYLSYFVAANANPTLRNGFVCELGQDHNHGSQPPSVYESETVESRGLVAEGTLRTYRLAMACTGEYAQFHGGTKAAALEAMVLKVNRLNQVFERDLAIRLELIENNDAIIFLDGATDNLSNGNTSSLLGQISNIINGIIGAANYDIGHVLNVHNDAVGNGVASLRSVCNDSQKARGVSGITIPEGDPFVIDIIAHEIGHQFGATHTMNSCQNVEPSTAYEPGSGVTIMSYAGICSPSNNIQNFTEDFYHSASIEQIFAYMREGAGDGCAVKTPTNNTPPTVQVPDLTGFFIPISTPFQLTATATDAENDELTYCWEQFDLGPNDVGLGNPQGNSPLFRTFQPTDSPTRVFPRLNKILTNNFDNSEVLPTYSRDLTFRCTVRDNNPNGGAVSWEQTAFKSDGTAGPFLITQPNVGSVEWTVGGYEEITWDVANTDNNRVRCYNVNILLSLDGGFTFPITLAEGTPNSGSAFVTVPDQVTNSARIRVEASENIFFDISDANFSIAAPAEPGYAMTATPSALRPVCLPTQTEISIATTSILGFAEPISLSLEGDLPAEASVTFADETILPGETTTMTIDWGTFVSDTFRLQIVGTTLTLDTTYRFLELVTVSNDFSELAALLPEDGAGGIVVFTPFSWTEVADAGSYDFELATSPDFNSGSIVFSATGVTNTEEYIPQNLVLENNRFFYWRVRGVNAQCGPGEWIAPSVFRTASISCDVYAAEDLPINLPTTTNVRTSSLMINDAGTISDINLSNIEISFQPVNAIRISLISPAGTRALLYDRNCLNTGLIRIGFDDEAQNNISCPPFNFQNAKPIEPLSIFDGEGTMGEWQLEVEIAASGGGGIFRSWSIEFCATTEFAPPSLLLNEPLRVPPGGANTFTTDQLQASGDGYSPAQLKYRIISLPQHGQLVRGGDVLSVNEHFTQQTIDLFNLLYVHDGSDTEEDEFLFTLETPDGGFTPTQAFRILIDEDAVVSTRELDQPNSMLLFPNPARDELNVQLGQAVSGEAVLALRNMQGQVLQERVFPVGARQLQLHTTGLPAGIYLVTLRTASGQLTKKVVVQR